MTTVLIMAGGTGGHIFPALAIADELAGREVKIVWLGAKGGMETKIVPKHNYQLETISITGLRGQKLITTLLIPWRLSLALWQTWKIVRHIQPNMVIGLGGFVTGPGGLVSWLLGKPLVIHEQNGVAGLTNRLLSRIATRVLTAFPNAFPASASKLVGNPVRQDISEIDEPTKRFNNRQNSTELNILVVGGSLGALRLNEVVPDTMQLVQKRLGEKDYSGQFKRFCIRHQSGRNKAKPLQDKILALGLSKDNSGSVIEYQITEFIDDMAEAYQWADIVICRAGALTISELSMVGIGSILVPYPFAVDDHQTVNAKYLESAGAAYLVAQEELVPACLQKILLALSGERLLDMAVKAKSLACPDATRDVADISMGLIAEK